ncbi:MAG: hypothetical protein LBB48_08505, partial [Treponema sp.]|nr:hypothetical protein [Treponema sp.]
MANDKKSSIYDDQSGAGSVSELDEYGVWVKSDPAETSASKKGDSDFLIPDDESSPDFEIGEIEEVSADELDIPMAEDIDDFEKEFIPEDLENGAEDVDALSFDNTLDPELDDIEELQVEDILKADPDFLAMETQKITEVPTIDALSLGDDTEEFAELASGLSAIDETASDESASEGGASNGETSQTDVAGENIASSEETPAHREGVDEKGATELFIEDFLDDSPFDDDEIMKKEKDAEEEKSAVAPTGDAPVVEAESVPVEAEEAVDAAVAPTGDAPVVEAESVPVEAEEAVDVAAGD